MNNYLTQTGFSFFISELGQAEEDCLDGVRTTHKTLNRLQGSGRGGGGGGIMHQGGRALRIDKDDIGIYFKFSYNVHISQTTAFID